MAHHSSTLAQLITSSIYEKTAILSLKMIKYMVQMWGHLRMRSTLSMVKLTYRLPFATKVGDKRPKN